MLPAHPKYGAWAASGEIDILEGRGQAPGVMSGSLHYWTEWPHDRYMTKNYSTSGPADFSTGFHDFAVEWTADPLTRRPLAIKWFVDKTLFYSVDLQDNVWFPDPWEQQYPQGAPWDQRFYLIINIAIGGQYFADHGYEEMRAVDDYNAAATTWESSVMIVEHVRVWTQRGFEHYTEV